MSIDAAQREQTSLELTALAASLTIDRAILAARLGLDPVQFDAILAVDPRVHPAEVWRLRDFLTAVADATGTPVPGFTVLRDDMRAQAIRWFGAWEVPSAEGLAAPSGRTC